MLIKHYNEHAINKNGKGGSNYTIQGSDYKQKRCKRVLGVPDRCSSDGSLPRASNLQFVDRFWFLLVIKQRWCLGGS
ncbi:unnamed protein product [Lathyrus oleraceus]